MYKFDKYDYSTLNYDLYFKKIDHSSDSSTFIAEHKNNVMLFRDQLFNNPYLCRLHKIVRNLLKNSQKYNIDLQSNGLVFRILSSNKYLTSDFIQKNINWNWNWLYIVNNSIVDLDFIEKYVPNYWQQHLSHPNPYYCKRHIITTNFIDKHIKKQWNWAEISYNTNITSDFIERHIDKPWVGIKPNVKNGIDLDFIERYIDKPWWNFQTLTVYIENKELSRGEKLKIINEKLSGHVVHSGWSDTGGHFTIPKQFVFKYYYKDWSWDCLLWEYDLENQLDEEQRLGINKRAFIRIVSVITNYSKLNKNCIKRYYIRLFQIKYRKSIKPKKLF